jgi:hypothetical protein
MLENRRTRTAPILCLLCLLAAACGDDGPRGPGREADVAGDAGGDTGTADSGGDEALPEECEVSVERADECVDSTVGPTTVLCEGAPVAMIVTHECEYLFTDVGAQRNVYCCP